PGRRRGSTCRNSGAAVRMPVIGHRAAGTSSDAPRPNCRRRVPVLPLWTMRPEPLPILRIVAGTRAAVAMAEAATSRLGDRVAVTLVGPVPVPRGCRVDGIGVALPPAPVAAAVIDGLDPFDRTAVRAL